MEQADWFVDSLEALREALPRHRVAMIGSGGGTCRVTQRGMLEC